MALSRLAAQFAAEIAQHEWIDAPFRADKAGHQLHHDSHRPAQLLTPQQADVVRMNVMWVTAQVLIYNDPNFSIVEFAAACGVHTTPGILNAGLRGSAQTGYQIPGTYLF